MIRFTENKEEYSEAKKMALEIINTLHNKYSDNYEVSIQALEIAFVSLLEEKYSPIELITSVVLSENIEAVKEAIKGLKDE